MPGTGTLRRSSTPARIKAIVRSRELRPLDSRGPEVSRDGLLTSVVSKASRLISLAPLNPEVSRDGLLTPAVPTFRARDVRAVEPLRMRLGRKNGFIEEETGCLLLPLNSFQRDFSVKGPVLPVAPPCIDLLPVS
jgi:hypothetical protein